MKHVDEVIFETKHNHYKLIKRNYLSDSGELNSHTADYVIVSSYDADDAGVCVIGNGTIENGKKTFNSLILDTHSTYNEYFSTDKASSKYMSILADALTMIEFANKFFVDEGFTNK